MKKIGIFIFLIIALSINGFSQYSISAEKGLLPRKNKKGKFGYVDTKGKKVIPYIYDYADYFNEKFAVVVINSNFRFIDEDGDYLTDELFDLAWPFSNGIALIYKNNKYGYIDTSGQILQNKWFDKAGQLFDNYAEAKIGKVNYLISIQGQVMNYGNNILPRNNAEIFRVVEKMPKFPGGTEMFLKYFRKELILKNIEIDKSIINISFIVERDGSLSDIVIKNQLNENFCNEIIKVLKILPPWIPGRHRGELVRVRYNFPLRIKISD